MENSKNRIPKTIRLDPAIDKDISKYCLLSGSSQADYINKALAEDLDKRTLERFAFKDAIFIDIPLRAESIASAIEVERDMRRFDSILKNDKQRVGIKINNFLDLWNGETFAKPDFNYIHSGINILDFNNTMYYVYTEFYFDKDRIRVLNEKTEHLFNSTDAGKINNYKEFIAPYIIGSEKIFIDRIILISKEDAIDYAYLSKNSALIDAMKNDNVSNDSDMYSNPASDIVEFKQIEKGRELEKTKNQLREAIKERNEQKQVIENLQDEIETLKKQNTDLQKAISNALDLI